MGRWDDGGGEDGRGSEDSWSGHGRSEDGRGSENGRWGEDRGGGEDGEAGRACRCSGVGCM